MNPDEAARLRNDRMELVTREDLRDLSRLSSWRGPADLCSLLKYTQFRKDALGENWNLYYLRDKEDREVDFVVTRNRRVHWLIEVKSSDTDLSGALRYYTEKLKPVESIQLVRNLERPLEKSGSRILPLGSWLESLTTAFSLGVMSL